MTRQRKSSIRSEPVKHRCKFLQRGQNQQQEEQTPQEPQQTQEARERKADSKTYTREIKGAIRALEGEGNERKFILSFSSEEPYDRGWCTEILDHSTGAIDLGRLEEIGVMLFNHHRDDVLGKINRVWVEGSKAYAEVEFDTDEQSETIYQKVKSGTLKGVSVGYRVLVWECVEPKQYSTDGRFEGPCDIARKWEPYEVSIVSVPADPTVGVGRDLEEETEERKSEHTEQKHAPTLRERQLQININRFM